MSEELVDREKIGEVLVLRWRPDHLDAANAKVFRTAVLPLVQTERRVVLDLADVGFIDSAGLGSLLSLMRNLTERGGDFRVCSVSRATRVLFELVRLHRILEIHDTREEAVGASAKT